MTNPNAFAISGDIKDQETLLKIQDLRNVLQQLINQQNASVAPPQATNNQGNNDQHQQMQQQNTGGNEHESQQIVEGKQQSREQ